MVSTTDFLLRTSIWSSHLRINSKNTVPRDFYLMCWKEFKIMIWPTCWNIIPSKILILVQASVRWRKTITLSKSIENVMLARSQRVRSKLCLKEAKYTVQILIIYLPTLYSMSLKGLAQYAILANNFVAYWLYYKHYSGLCWNTHSLALYKVITRNNSRKYLLLM